MALKVQTTIINLDNADWSGGQEDILEQLKPVQECGAMVTVLCEVTDGYYDIELPNGDRVDALSWFHLEGFTEEGIEL